MERRAGWSTRILPTRHGRIPLIIHMPREIDHHNCRNMKRDTDLLLEENYINCIVFDFTHTEFMDSSGVGILLNRYKQMDASRGRAVYYGAGPQVKADS